MLEKESTSFKLKSLGTTIKTLRLENEMSQLGLAKVTGLHRNYISDVENGGRNLSFESLMKLSSGLGVKLHELVQDL